MKSVKKINNNPAEQTVGSWMAISNAYAEQQIKLGKKSEYLTAENAKDTYKKLIKTVVAFANPSSKKHNIAFNAIKEQVGSKDDTMTILENTGKTLLGSIEILAQNAVKRGKQLDGDDGAIAEAVNSLAGNPVYDHFGNLNILASQMYEDMTFVENFIAEGDAFALPTENGGTNQDKSRFRAPVEKVSGSAKTSQGDINPTNHMRDDNNRIQVSLYNEFKNSKVIDAVFSITQPQRDQLLGYQTSVYPALAGFILQNRYSGASIQSVMKQAELEFVDGMDVNGSYDPNSGGGYGILSPAIQLALSDWQSAAPTVANGSSWDANPTKLIQKISNLNYVPITVAGELPTNLDPKLMYQDIVRLFNLPAQQNVDFMAKKWTLYVPTTFYGLTVQYPGGSGTFNKNLKELILTATGKIINDIDIRPSSLMNYRARNSYGNTSAAYNYMALIAHGSPNEKKPVIMPGQTAIPYIVSENVSASIMNFRTIYTFGGPMITHLGGCYLMEFSKAT